MASPMKRRRVVLTTGKEAPQHPLYDFLNKFMDVLRAKDVYGFFHDPVDESIAPDYFSIIRNPMDFKTLQALIDNHEITSFSEWQEKLELIFSNAMIYNAPDSPYYREANKILQYTRKQIAKEIIKYNGPLLFEEKKISTAKPSVVKWAQYPVFSSLLPYVMDENPDLPFRPDGSIDLSGHPDLYQQVSVEQLHPLPSSNLGSVQILSEFLKRSTAKRGEKYATNLEQLMSPLQYPFYSFSPFYDTKNGFPINGFDFKNEALVYGDPKGKAFIQSLKKYMSTKRTEDILLKIAQDCTMSADEYLEKAKDFKVAKESNDTLDPDMRRDWMLMVRYLRWLKMIPDLEQFKDIDPQVILQSIPKTEEKASEDPRVLQKQLSTLLLQCHLAQLKRFRSSQVDVPSDDEKMLLKETKSILLKLVSIAQPRDVSAKGPLGDFMNELTDEKTPYQYPGTLPNK